ncbi:MAG TPA: O-antigen ligase family protein [Hyphomicrobiaceae bacterium]|nr:O-antigen ligase family protein [Hyphomicrobiaceae bacterium]
MATAYFLACLMLGGGTRAGFFSDVALQMLAVPLLLWAAWRLIELPPDAGRKQGRIAILVCLLAAAIPLVQLVPMPPALWTALPGRADFVSALEAAGLEPGWRPISVSPRGTWLSAIALLPPAAVLLCAAQLGYAERRRIAIVLLAFGMVAAALGLLQVAQGTASPLRFYAFTNATETVGFFANRNHHAALLYVLVPIAAAMSIAAVIRTQAAGSIRSRRASPHLIVAMLGLAALVVLVAAQAITRSRAGIGLTLVALLGSLAMTYAGRFSGVSPSSKTPDNTATRTGRRLLIAAFGLAVLMATQLAFHRVQTRFASGPLEDGRVLLVRTTIEGARAFMPFGSGMGTFVPVYKAFERPVDDWGAFINRAHNDYLELWLEAGLIGIVAMIVALGWIAAACVRVWRSGLPGAGQRDSLLACAATLVLFLLLMHSMVDYPLRTTALMAVFAFAAALVHAPLGAEAVLSARSSEPAERRKNARPRSLEPEPDAMAEPQSDGARFAPLPPRTDWPVAWRRPGRPDRPPMPKLPGSVRTDDRDESEKR